MKVPSPMILSTVVAKWNMAIPTESAVIFNREQFNVVQNAMMRRKVEFCYSWFTLGARAVTIKGLAVFVNIVFLSYKPEIRAVKLN